MLFTLPLLQLVTPKTLGGIKKHKCKGSIAEKTKEVSERRWNSAWKHTMPACLHQRFQAEFHLLSWSFFRFLFNRAIIVVFLYSSKCFRRDKLRGAERWAQFLLFSARERVAKTYGKLAQLWVRIVPLMWFPSPNVMPRSKEHIEIFWGRSTAQSSEDCDSFNTCSKLSKRSVSFLVSFLVWLSGHKIGVIDGNFCV